MFVRHGESVLGRIDPSPALRVNVQRNTMICERKNRFVDRRPIYRSGLEPWQDPHSAPATAGFLKQNPARSNNERMIFGQSFHSRALFLYREHFRIFGAAKFFNWTDRAFRPRQTNHSAQIDECGIVTAGGTSRYQGSRVIPQGCATSGLVDRRLQIEEPRQNARSIRFDNRYWLIKREAGNSVRSIFSHSRELLHLLD